MSARDHDPSLRCADAGTHIPRSPKPHRPKPARGEAYGILNPWGDFWTYETFKTESEARNYLAKFWSAPGFGPQDLTKFRVVPARVTVTAPPAARDMGSRVAAQGDGASSRAEHDQ